MDSARSNRADNAVWFCQPPFGGIQGHNRLTAILCRRLVLGLILFHRRVVVDKHICSVVLWVLIACSTLVTRTEITLLRPSALLSYIRPHSMLRTYRLVVFWQLNLTGSLPLTLPWSLRPKRSLQEKNESFPFPLILSSVRSSVKSPFFRTPRIL